LAACRAASSFFWAVEISPSVTAPTWVAPPATTPIASAIASARRRQPSRNPLPMPPAISANASDATGADPPPGDGRHPYQEKSASGGPG
jgi:hypothetical protein